MKPIILRLMAPVCLTAILVGATSCGKSRTSEMTVYQPETEYQDSTASSEYVAPASESYEAVVVEETTEAAVESAAEHYKERRAEIKRDSRATIAYEDGRNIFWYRQAEKEPYVDGVRYEENMYWYDSERNFTYPIYLNQTSMEYFSVTDMMARDGIVTIIMEENRNSNGWVEGTYVWQYNCKTDSWKPIAKACSGAEFVNGGKAVRINNATCPNPDDPTYLQEWTPHYRTVKL